MQMPSITGFYLGILALLYVVLGLQVSRLRRGNRSLFGDGDNIKLRSAIRAHANFAEYVPIIVLMVALLEMSGMPAARVHLLDGRAAGGAAAASARHVCRPAHPAVSDLPGRRHSAHAAGHARRRLLLLWRFLAGESSRHDVPTAYKDIIIIVSLTLF